MLTMYFVAYMRPGNLSYGVKGLYKTYKEVVLEKTALIPRMVYVNIFVLRLFCFQFYAQLKLSHELVRKGGKVCE